jgi:N-acyl-D-aspartate/D-glutamate deacylase
MRDNLNRQNGPHTILFTHRGQPWSGKYLDEVAKEWKVDPIEAAIRILRQTDKQSLVGFDMSEPDIETFMKQSYTATGSDGGDGHPRQYATYPTKYVEYVVKRHVIGLGQFIRSSSGLPADILMLDHRGYLKPGYYADVVVFDPKAYAPRADYVNWDRLSVGVVDLAINGKLAIDNGKMTVALSGRPLPHKPTPGSCL